MRRARTLRRRRTRSLHVLRESGHRLRYRALLRSRLLRLLRGTGCLRSSGLLLLRSLRWLRLLSLPLLSLSCSLAQHHADQVLLHALQLHLLLGWRQRFPLRTSHQRIALCRDELLLLRRQGEHRPLLTGSRRRGHVARPRRGACRERWRRHRSGELLHALRADW